MSRVSLPFAALALTLLGVSSAYGQTEETTFGSNPGNLVMYIYAPPALASGAPLVMVLPGCGQDVTFAQRAGVLQLAQSRGFGVVIAEQSLLNNAARCFNWFSAADIARTGGEAQSIAQMVVRGHDLLDTDPARTYVMGLSAGGAMAAVMAAVYPELFAGALIAAGVPVGCADSALEAPACMFPGVDASPLVWGDAVRSLGAAPLRWPRVSIWHGDADLTVAPANGGELAEQWVNVHGLSGAGLTSQQGATQREVWSDGAGVPRVERWSVAGMGHGVAVDPGSGCGSASVFEIDRGVCTLGLALDFWSAGEGGMGGGGSGGGQASAGTGGQGGSAGGINPALPSGCTQHRAASALLLLAMVALLGHRVRRR